MPDEPDDYLRRPPMPAGAVLEEFERLYREAIAPGTGARVDYRLEAPVWQFLCWLGDTKDVVLHGSASREIEEFEPRLPGDNAPWAHRELVFATDDGIWSMYYAILDRSVAWSLYNAAFTVDERPSSTAVVRYHFSINDDALRSGRWSTDGAVYLLPKAGFEPEPPELEDGRMVYGRQWTSLSPVRPLAVVPVRPSDFPFLDEMRGHEVPADVRAERERRLAGEGTG